MALKLPAWHKFCRSNHQFGLNFTQKGDDLAENAAYIHCSRNKIMLQVDAAFTPSHGLTIRHACPKRFRTTLQEAEMGQNFSGGAITLIKSDPTVSKEIYPMNTKIPELLNCTEETRDHDSILCHTPQ